MALPKRAAPIKAGNQNPLIDDPAFKADLPNLYSFLMDDVYADGSKRLTGGISFFSKYGSLVASINDNDRGLVAYMSSASFAELLQLIDMGISDDSLDWKGKTPKAPEQKLPF